MRHWMRVMDLMLASRMSVSTYFTGAFIPADLLQTLRNYTGFCLMSSPVWALQCHKLLLPNQELLVLPFTAAACWKDTCLFLLYMTSFFHRDLMRCYYNVIPNIHNKKNHHADDQFAEWLSPSLNRQSTKKSYDCPAGNQKVIED